jgi:tartrate dehydratase beta subunit/fumarate hydratase class I family protein
MMFTVASRIARPLVSQAARRHQPQLGAGFATVKEGLTATDAWNKSCYSGIDYTINEDLPVYDAVQKFAAYNVGCLVTVDADGKEKFATRIYSS